MASPELPDIHEEHPLGHDEEDSGNYDTLLPAKKSFDPTASCGTTASTAVPEDSRGLGTWSTDDLRSSTSSRSGWLGDESISTASFALNSSCLNKKDMEDTMEDQSERPPGLPELNGKTETSQSLPSIGSQEHGTGTCRPCAWFYKPDSCKNGRECRHCHLCPEGEIKSRKKTKLTTMRISKIDGGCEQQTTDVDQQGSDSRETGEGNTEKASALTPPPGLASLPTDQGLAKPDGPMPSVGAEKHDLGECKPCAWFWKPGSCSNGKDCKHCHLCPEGELKSRKRLKMRTAQQSKSPERRKEAGVDTTPEAFEDSTADRENKPVTPLNREALPFVPHGKPPGLPAPNESEEGEKAAWYSKGGSLNGQAASTGRLKDKAFAKDDEDQEAIRELGQDSEDSMDAAAEPDAAPTEEVAVDLQDDLPSNGSSLHALGKCKPCAWFHKEGGCVNGRECCHCHLCPESELRKRRKAKEAAMRIGALMPARIPKGKKHSRTSHVLKLLPLI